MLSNDLTAQINGVLGGSDPYFAAADFAVTSSRSKTRNGTPGGEVQIVYRHLSDCNFTALIPGEKTKNEQQYDPDYDITVRTRPGRALREEMLRVRGTSYLLREIAEWLTIVKTEASAIPINREMERQRARIDEVAARFDTIEDEYLTREEAEALSERLTTLEGQFEAKIVEMTRDEQEREKQLKHLHAELETLRGQLQTFTKSGIVRRMMATIFKIGRNPAVQKLALEAAEKGIDKLLPPHSG
ncbi:MAG: hypothetical protein FWD73_15215 [Polyangiaceae bacterium]|nr:hypothetical protein [Polyangiaceae bacterium]